MAMVTIMIMCICVMNIRFCAQYLGRLWQSNHGGSHVLIVNRRSHATSEHERDRSLLRAVRSTHSLQRVRLLVDHLYRDLSTTCSLHHSICLNVSSVAILRP
jgi:hypothetical protein